jgi:hypothetical protein
LGKVKLFFWPLLFFLSFNTAQAQTIIKKIDYTNIEQTKIRVIEREMPFALFDTLPDIQRTLYEFENRVVSLGLFTQVNLSMINDSTLLIKALEKVYVWGLPIFSLADPNFSQWLQTKDIKRIALGADLFATNLRGLKNQISISGLIGFNSYATILYEKVPQGRQWNQGFFVKAGVGFRSQQKIGIDNDKLVWKNGTNPYLKYRKVGAGLNWRKGLFRTLGIQANTEFIQIAPNGSPNNLFAQEDSTINYYGFTAHYTLDKRVQQHFPVAGFYFNSKIHLKKIIGNRTSWTVPEINVKANKYLSMHEKWILKAGLVGTYQLSETPFYYSTGLGLDRDYIRGYEPYTFIGKGYILGRISLAYGLKNNKKVKITEKKWSKNYGTMPFSLWCSIFAENGKIVEPVLVGNTLANKNLYSIGLSLQALAYYNSSLRMDVALNRLSQVIGNVSFRNAF